MRILITDVTEMHHGNYCVAGWSQGKMVRPLPRAANWTADLLVRHRVAPGVSLEVKPIDQPVTGSYPHRTEDTPIDAVNIVRLNLPVPSWFGGGAPPTAATLSDAFQNHLAHNSVWNGRQQGVHVPDNTQCRSLWAVQIAPGGLKFLEEFGKLRGLLADGVAEYKLAVSGASLKEMWRSKGVDALNKSLPKTRPLHVRVGLARSFAGQAGKCSVMINGVYW